ncbi:MAG TPA: cysteine--tRNA ligase [Dehalococcoidia bacterium]|nr:cysteine--tRNA ligase [Dehalococcoidia bacterium]
MRLYNTLTSQLEEFTPRDGKVSMYVCGITPYSESHLGHAMSYVIFDTLRRYLEYRGIEVKHVQNYTDIDDKLIARAEREGATVAQIADRYIAEFERDTAELNILPAHVYPRATEEVPSIIEMIEGLIAKGYAYPGPARDGASDVYYRVEKKADYGKLSKRSLDSMLSGARIEPLEGKENPMDFTLWKAAKPGEPAWDSPWGPGRPGWHIECSAMSLRHLGPQIDIHGGGLDLVFPHHENEIAQTEAYTGVVPFSRFWVHNGFVQMGEEKMSKSLGNLITMREALDTYGADGVRAFILSNTYRRPLTYSEEAMAAGKTAAERLRTAVSLEDTGAGEALDASAYKERYIAAMEDDLNTAQAMAVLFDLARDINRSRDAGLSVGAAQATLRELAGILGLRLDASEDDSTRGTFVTRDVARGLLAAFEAAANAGLIQETLGRLDSLGPEESGDPVIQMLIRLRKELRDAKQYALADRIRDGLGELSITLEDGPSGTTWKAGG